MWTATADSGWTAVGDSMGDMIMDSNMRLPLVTKVFMISTKIHLFPLKCDSLHLRYYIPYLPTPFSTNFQMVTEAEMKPDIRL